MGRRDGLQGPIWTASLTASEGVAPGAGRKTAEEGCGHNRHTIQCSVISVVGTDNINKIIILTKSVS